MSDRWDFITTDNPKDVKEPIWKFIRIYDRDDSITMTAKLLVNLLLILPLFITFWVAVLVAFGVSVLGAGVKYLISKKER